MPAPSNYPLSWPAGRPRTAPNQRKNGQFKTTRGAFTISVAADRVEDEIERLGGKHLVISSEVPPTLSGRPRSGMGAPSDPGVALYFLKDNEPVTLACDHYTKVEQNLAALAAHIEAVRRIERHGVQTAKEILRAFMALPPPQKQKPWNTLGVARSATVDQVKSAYRDKAKTMHPDQGGEPAAWNDLHEAYEQMMFLLGEQA